MKARVNPFTREVILDNEREELSVQFTELDEWSGVKFSDGSSYDIHFYYEDTFQLSVYLIEDDGDVTYDTNVITKINIEY
tara:strand:- start:585 stop:824 length:240 start_codon:yes stop_codon:yes gene_type:complete